MATSGNPAGGVAPGAEAPVQFTASRNFASWLEEAGVSIGFTTYQTGKLFLVGSSGGERLSIHERTFNRAMGLWACGSSLYLGTLYQVWRLENALAPGETHDGYDALYVPRLAYTTGDVDIHDIAVDHSGRILFVNTLFSCIAATSPTHSFVPVWVPPFVSRLAAEDRCHLNGMTLVDGRPRYVTTVSRSDVADGWRERRTDGGCVIDIDNGAPVVEGLSMPHSPRIRDGRLWLLDSGRGKLGVVDGSRFQPVAFCPGYLRGLAFTGHHAIVGLSKPRHNVAFAGLELDDALAKVDGEARCGLQVIDVRSGDVVHWLRIDGIIKELYDVAVLPGTRRPMSLGFRSTEIERIITIAGGDGERHRRQAAEPLRSATRQGGQA